MNIAYYSCSVCGAQYSPREAGYVCPLDGGNLTIHLEFETSAKKPDPKGVLRSREPSIWRYLPLLPVNDPGFHGTP